MRFHVFAILTDRRGGGEKGKILQINAFDPKMREKKRQKKRDEEIKIQSMTFYFSFFFFSFSMFSNSWPGIYRERLF